MNDLIYYADPHITTIKNANKDHMEILAEVVVSRGGAVKIIAEHCKPARYYLRYSWADDFVMLGEIREDR